jgi:hypothetical protein
MNNFYDDSMGMAWIVPVAVGIIVLLVLMFPDVANEILTKMSK